MRRSDELKPERITRVGLLAFVSLVVMAACSATQPQVMPAGAVAGVKAGGEPRELLYTLGGSPQTRHPFIEVFDARDKSQQPKPIYTIAPRDGGEYGLLSVDSTNHLYAINSSRTGPSSISFRPGQLNQRFPASSQITLAASLSPAPRFTRPALTGIASTSTRCLFTLGETVPSRAAVSPTNAQL